MKIEVKNLTKKYGDKYALKDISFTLDGAKIYGLLGRNGAGKTTFMNILSGQILASSGEILNPFDKVKPIWYSNILFTWLYTGKAV